MNSSVADIDAVNLKAFTTSVFYDYLLSSLADNKKSKPNQGGKTYLSY